MLTLVPQFHESSNNDVTRATLMYRMRRLRLRRSWLATFAIIVRFLLNVAHVLKWLSRSVAETDCRRKDTAKTCARVERPCRDVISNVRGV